MNGKIRSIDEKKSKRRRVALILESSRAYARELIGGIARYNREVDGWQIDFSPRGLNDPPPNWLKSWKGDGIIARINDPLLLKEISNHKVPMIDLRRVHVFPGIPQIGPDYSKVTHLLFQHFRDRGYHSFAFFGYQELGSNFISKKSDRSPLIPAMQTEIILKDLANNDDCHFVSFRTGSEQKREDIKGKSAVQMLKWLSELPVFTAIIAANDDMALHVLQGCRQVGREVPDDLAVAGIGNDECLCTLGLPPLTSVDLAADQVGYEAAEMLDRMMKDPRWNPPAATFIPPREVVVRSSTDTIATADPILASAVRFIREHVCSGITVRDVLRHVHLSRVALENRFKRELHRTVHQEIIEVRIRRVSELLATTSFSFRRIADETGFEYPEYMMRVFREKMGKTLKEYREENS